MSELLEVDYGNEDIQNENRNHQMRIDLDKEPIQEKKSELIEERDSSLKKNFEKIHKDPIYFVLRLSEEILSSSLSSNHFIISEDVYKGNQKYFETYINVYVILLANESNIIKAFTKKAEREKVFEGNAVKIPFDLRFDVSLPVNEIMKETSKLTEKDIRFEEILTKISTLVGEKLRNIISWRSKKKIKTNPSIIENKLVKGDTEKNDEKIRLEIKNESGKNEKKECIEKKDKNNQIVTKKERRSISKPKNNDKSSKNKNRKKSSHSRKSSSSSSRKKSYPVYHPGKYPIINKKTMINPLLKVPQQQYYPPYDYSIPAEQNLSYYYQQSYYPHNPINPMFQPKYPMNPAYIPWINHDMKDNMLNPPHGEYMKNYFFEGKVGFEGMRDYEDMNIHPPINISNINFIKNNQKKEDYSRKKRRRKSYSDSSSSSSDSSSMSRKKKSSYNNKDKKTDKKYESKPKYEKGNKSLEKREEKVYYKERNSKFKIVPETKQTANEIKTQSNIKENNQTYSEDKEANKSNNTNFFNDNKVIAKFHDKSDSGENTDDLMKNSPILNKFSEEKKRQQKQERKTKFSDENPILKRSDEIDPNARAMTIQDNSNINENTSHIENSNLMNVSIKPTIYTKDEELKSNMSNENKQISLLKKPIALNIQMKTKSEISNDIHKTNEEEKEEGEIEERTSKNFKIVNSLGKKKILLTNKRKVNEIKVVRKENNYK